MPNSAESPESARIYFCLCSCVNELSDVKKAHMWKQEGGKNTAAGKMFAGRVMAKEPGCPPHLD